MFLKKFLLSAALVLTTAGASMAATCNIGTCMVTHGVDGQNLSSGVLFSLDDIHNATTGPNAGTFNFSGTFMNDTTGNANAQVTVLQFAPTNLGKIGNLVLTLFYPNNTVQNFQITDANGAGLNMQGNDSVVRLNLQNTPNQMVSFKLEGTAIAGLQNAAPDLNIVISAVPLPAGILLLGSGLAGLGLARRRKTA